MGKRQLGAAVGPYEVSTVRVWGTGTDSDCRDPHVSFLALRHWSRLPRTDDVNFTVDDVCGAIAGLDREAVEWPLIDSIPGWRGGGFAPSSTTTRLLANVVRQVGLPTRSSCN